ncbi:hypothetical protein [Dyadobacter sp. CY326]|uniref:hypothetical protein n=1 Tax=Dyadobacter sp. CY326 TaxID=2907300 RepID=UPI001F3DECC9|nr:hypothetical protein [Dyadobacter sp. CY326]MCE7064271.1 hypothetical protein [Dyadobacter sp. CY326]
MLEIIENYMQLKKNMGALINKSGYKNAFLAEQMGMAAPTFSVKKQRGNWTEHEMKQILAIIENEKLEDYFFLEILRAKPNEPKMPIADLKRELGW